MNVIISAKGSFQRPSRSHGEDNATDSDEPISLIRVGTTNPLHPKREGGLAAKFTHAVDRDLFKRYVAPEPTRETGKILNMY